MTPIQAAIGEVFYGAVETLTGRHRSNWLGYDNTPTGGDGSVRFYLLLECGKISPCIRVGMRGEIRSIEFEGIEPIRMTFILQSFIVALGALLDDK